jgi:signal recognition particle receptor subunit beta
MNRDEGGRIHFKIVVWGPFESGKTTVVKWYYENAEGLSKGGFTSVENNLGQTVYFDYASLSTGEGVVYDFFAVGGSDSCRRERKALVEGTDAVVFIADSRSSKIHSNLESLEELSATLGKSYANMAVIFVLNKRDLIAEDLIDPAEFGELPNIKGHEVFETAAKMGAGISEPFKYLTLGLAQRTVSVQKIPQAPREITSVGVALLSLAEGFEPSLEATYPEGLSIGPEETKSLGSIHAPRISSDIFVTLKTQNSYLCSYQAAKRDQLGVSHIVTLVLPANTPQRMVASLFERFYESAPVLFQYRDATSLSDISKTLPQFYIVARDQMTSESIVGGEPFLPRPREILRSKLFTEGACGAIDEDVSYLSFLQNQKQYELLYAPCRTGATLITNIFVDEYAMKTVIKDVERIQNNLLTRMKTATDPVTRRKHVQAYLTEMKGVNATVGSQLFNKSILTNIAEDNPRHLTVEVERQLFTVPLEILQERGEYLCLKRSFSRWITEEQGSISIKEKPKAVPRLRRKNEPLSVLVIDSRIKKIPPVSPGDFAGQLIKFLTAKDAFGKLEVKVDSLRGELKKEEVAPRLSTGKYDIIHIISPAQLSSGDPMGCSWILSKGEISGYELEKLFAKGYPALILSHVSYPPTEREWDAGQENRILYSFALSAKTAGVECFIGQVAQELTETTFTIATSLYREMLVGKKTVGEAVRATRLHLIETNGREDDNWMKTILYGNPAKTIA